MKNKKYTTPISMVLIVLTLLVFFPWRVSHAIISRPENIRIGLFYQHGSRDTTLNNITLTALGGMQVGIHRNGQFQMVRELHGIAQVYLDHASNGHHIRIEGNYGDINSLQTRMDQLTAMGLHVFPVLDAANTWQIWEGIYHSRETAERALSESILPRIGAGNHGVVNPSSNRILMTHENGQPALACESQTAFLTVRSARTEIPRTVTINGRDYRGSLEFRPTHLSLITVINQLHINEYLFGVVPLEIGTTNTPFEAIRAQAVAARTYALNPHRRHANQGFDLCRTECCQAYGGFEVEHPITNSAVNATSGVVAMFGGNLATLYYFSSSGGRTENSENVWSAALPHLRGVPDPYETVRFWSYTFTAAELTEHMLRSGRNIGTVTDVRILSFTQSGRALELAIVGTNGSAVFTRANTRNAFPIFLPSQMFSIGNQATFTVAGGNNTFSNVPLIGSLVRTATTIMPIQTTSSVLMADAFRNLRTVNLTPAPIGQFVITGAGRGHGVGMSQHGAMGMARAGYTYEQILKHYYTGIELVRINFH